MWPHEVVEKYLVPDKSGVFNKRDQQRGVLR